MSNCYYNIINNICFKFIVEDSVYNDNSLFFNYFFQNWNKEFKSSITKDVIVIGKNKRKKKNYIYVDTNDERCIFYLINEIENIIINRLGMDVLHGATIIYNNKVFCLLGPRKSGKTTILYNLLLKKKSFYIDDDCVILHKNKIFGLNFPMRLRDYQEKCFEIIDDDKKTRYLYFPKNIVANANLEIVFLFIEFNDIENNIRQIGKREFFNQLLINSRFSLSISNKFHNLLDITREQKAYYIKFTSFNNFLNLFQKI